MCEPVLVGACEEDHGDIAGQRANDERAGLAGVGRERVEYLYLSTLFGRSDQERRVVSFPLRWWGSIGDALADVAGSVGDDVGGSAGEKRWRLWL